MKSLGKEAVVLVIAVILIFVANIKNYINIVDKINNS